MDLSNLIVVKNIKKKMIIGRGIGSGKGGHTVGSGAKGQKARKGHKIKMGFEGGQVPLYKRLPQLGGFNNPTKKDIFTISLNALNVFKEGSTVTIADLIKKNIIKRAPKYGVKILADGKLEKKLTLVGFSYSVASKEIVEKSGSTLE